MTKTTGNKRAEKWREQAKELRANKLMNDPEKQRIYKQFGRLMKLLEKAAEKGAIQTTSINQLKLIRRQPWRESKGGRKFYR